MADVTVKVELNSDWKETIKKLPPVKGALTKEANVICARANGMAAGFKTGRYYDRTAGKLKGETPAVYGMKPTKEFGRTTVALVYAQNYAAQKDTYTNNTLLKAVGNG